MLNYEEASLQKATENATTLILQLQKNIYQTFFLFNLAVEL